MSAADKPTPRQLQLLRYAAMLGGQAGTLGTHKGTWRACVRRGWLEEVSVERKMLGWPPGLALRLTDAGRAVLEQEGDDGQAD